MLVYLSEKIFENGSQGNWNLFYDFFLFEPNHIL